MKLFRLISILFNSLLLFSCDPFGTKIGEEVTYFEAIESENISYPDTLTVMTWNVKFGGGRIDFFFDCHGDRVIMEKEEVENNMNLLADKIREVNPDILFLQEVDIDAKRSAFVNQLQNLLDNTALNYGVYAGLGIGMKFCRINFASISPIIIDGSIVRSSGKIGHHYRKWIAGNF